MIKRFILPDTAFSVEQLIDTMCRCTFDPLHDLGQAKYISLGISQGTDHHMNMVGHHYDPMNNQFFAVVM